MANCMKNIAEGLGVGLNEVFCIDTNSDYYRITEDGLEMDVSDDSLECIHDWRPATDQTLLLLIWGEIEITKLPWTPKKDEIYYTPFISGGSLFTSYAWSGDDVDRANLKKGVVCRTPEEATEMAKKMLAAIKEK